MTTLAPPRITRAPAATVPEQTVAERSVGSVRAATLAWTLVVLSSFDWEGGLLHLSHRIEALITALTTLVAFGVAVLSNRRLVFRFAPGIRAIFALGFLGVLPFLAGIAGMRALIGAARLLMVASIPLLLTPSLRRDPFVLFRTHLRVYTIAAVCFIAGGLLMPSIAWDPAIGRLNGLIPPVPGPRVGEIGAIVSGLSIIMVVSGRWSPRRGIPLSGLGAGVALLSHTRTAVAALVIGCALGLLAGALRHPRARVAVVVFCLAAFGVFFIGRAVATDWFLRNESVEQLSELTGRTDVWRAVIAAQPDGLERWVGVGIGDKSFQGRHIDGGWVAAYRQQGIAGIIVAASLMLGLLARALRERDATLRMAGVFLLSFILVSSWTEVGISDVSHYMLWTLVVASTFAFTPGRVRAVGGEGPPCVSL